MIQEAYISALEHPVTALDDRPALSAADLKAYFDANPHQLMQAHNRLVNSLADGNAAGALGFATERDITGTTVQAAIEDVHRQLQGMAIGSMPDGSITESKLDSQMRGQLAWMMQTVDTLQTTVDNMNPNGAPQFALMVQALLCKDDDTAEQLATVALGFYYESHIAQLGRQLGWLCEWQHSGRPSEAFLAKDTYAEILNDPVTRAEIAALPPVLQLIQLSTEGARAYHNAIENGE